MPIFSRKLLLTLTLAFMTALPAPALAEGPPLALELADGDFVLIPHLQYRPRFVVHTGKNFMDGDTYHAFHQRARLGLEVKAWDWVQAKIELQDVRVWGEETNTLGDFSADGFDLHQAYITMTCPVGFFFRIGRQEINFDNQRLIGAVGWSNQARSFDAIHLGYNKGDFESKLGDIKVIEREKIQEAVKRGEELADGIVTDARSQADTTRQKAEADLDIEAQKARVELRDSVVNMAVGAAEKVIGERLDDQKHRQLIQEYIDNLGELPNA